MSALVVRMGWASRLPHAARRCQQALEGACQAPVGVVGAGAPRPIGQATPVPPSPQ
jgi:hypothetical protein